MNPSSVTSASSSSMSPGSALLTVMGGTLASPELLAYPHAAPDAHLGYRGSYAVPLV
jgi:hypothetical protein